MTLHGVMAIILRYFAEFGRFRGQLRKSGWLAINRFSPEICHKVHQLSTTDRCTLRGSGASCLYSLQRIARNWCIILQCSHAVLPSVCTINKQTEGQHKNIVILYTLCWNGYTNLWTSFLVPNILDGERDEYENSVEGLRFNRLA